MPIRLKILSVVVALLTIFGVVILYSATQHRRLAAEIEAIGEYNLPIRAALSDFDANSDEYELTVLRLIRRSDVPQAEIESETARAHRDAAKLVEEVKLIRSRLEDAVVDNRLPVESRQFYSALKSSFPFVVRDLDNFIKVGERVLEAIAKGRSEEARALSLEFRKTEQAFGPDTALLRQKLAEASESRFRQVLDEMRTLERINYMLFALAVGLGIVVSWIVSRNIVRGLRRLVNFSKAVQAGERDITVPVRTSDEVGQLAVAFNQMVAEIRDKERIQHAFGMFVDPRLVGDLVKGTGTTDHADRQVATVFFSDIAGFTSISEELTPLAMVKLLNHYFATVTESIRANNGIVDKFIGDAVMAFWCEPFSPGDSHAAAACRSALAQQALIAKINQELPNVLGLRRSAPTIAVRMGIATGEVILGTIGSTLAKSFTVVGDNVNLASRLESVNKVFGTRIIVTESTVRLAGSEVETRELDLVLVAGKSEPVRIFELLCLAGQLKAGEADLHHEFAQGLAAYRQQDWDAADRQFRRCLEINAKDPPTMLYLERIVTLRAAPPAGDWDGVWRFTQK